MYIIICHPQRFLLKSPSKKWCWYQSIPTHTCMCAYQARYRLCHIQCLPFIFFIISSHTNTLDTLFTFWVGKYVQYRSCCIHIILVLWGSESERRDRRVYINMAKLNTKGGNVARQPGCAYTKLRRISCETLRGVSRLSFEIIYTTFYNITFFITMKI